MNATRVLIVVGGAGALLAATLILRSAGLVPSAASPQPAATTEGPALSDHVDFSQTFKDLEGREIRLSDFSGKPLIINLWATWCGPCRIEMPQLVELSKKYKDRVAIVGISVDDTPDQIREFAGEFKVTYPLLVGLGKEPALTALGYQDLLPLSVFVRADGTVSYRLTGIATTDAWERRIQALF